MKSGKWGIFWLAVLLIFWGGSTFHLYEKPVVNTSLLALLPEEHDSILQTLTHQMAESAAKRMVVFFEAKDFDTNKKALEQFCHTLTTEKELFTQLQCHYDPQALNEWINFYASDHLPLLSLADRYLLQQNQSDRIVTETLNDLYSPISVRMADVVQDPFNLLTRWSQEFAQISPIQPKEGFLSLKSPPSNQSVLLVMVELAQSPFNFNYQRQVTTLLQHARDAVPAEVTLTLSGLVLHAEAGSKLAQREISTIGVGSLLVVILLLWLACRSGYAMLLAAIPLLAGTLSAFFLTALLRGSIHVITIAFGATLVGVSIDYTLHYLTQWYGDPVSLTGRSVIRAILPGISMGLVSTIIGFAALAIPDFPGLREMAFFSITGLLTSWLTVVLIFPLLFRKKPVIRQGLSRTGMFLHPVYRALFPYRRWVLGTLVVSLLFSLLFLGWLKPRDDLRLLNSSPVELIKNDQKAHQWLNLPSLSRFFLVSGKTPEQCLQHEEHLLESLSIKGLDTSHWLSVSRFIPSQKKQKEDRLLIQQQLMHSPTGLTALISATGMGEPFQAQILSRFDQTAGHEVSLQAWLEHPVSAPYHALWAGKIKEHYYSVIPLPDGLSAKSLATLSNAAQSLTDVRLLDRVERITHTLKTYRIQISYWLGLGYLMVFMFLLLRYRRESWQVIFPPLLASAMTLCLVQLISGFVTLFHVLALLVVMGVGLDYGIFIRESKASVATLCAVHFSFLTTLASFGLLALCKTPILHFFGVTLFTGITLVWVFTQLFVSLNDAPAPTPAPKG